MHTLVTGVPHARAITASSRANGRIRTASNAYFSVGHCLFEVGDSLNGGSKQSAAIVTSAAKSIAKQAPGICS